MFALCNPLLPKQRPKKLLSSLRSRGHSYTLPHIEFSLYKNSFVNRCFCYDLTTVLWLYVLTFYVLFRVLFVYFIFLYCLLFICARLTRDLINATYEHELWWRVSYLAAVRVGSRRSVDQSAGRQHSVPACVHNGSDGSVPGGSRWVHG